MVIFHSFHDHGDIDPLITGTALPVVTRQIIFFDKWSMI